jgi:hypothetical protein
MKKLSFLTLFLINGILLFSCKKEIGKADFTFGTYVNDSIFENEVVKFNLKNINAYGFKWVFGDNSSKTTYDSKSLEHTFSKKGTYNVTLSNLKKDGTVDNSVTKTINVYRKPLANEEIVTLYFTSNYSGVPTNVELYIGNTFKKTFSQHLSSNNGNDFYTTSNCDDATLLSKTGAFYKFKATPGNYTYSIKVNGTVNNTGSFNITQYGSCKTEQIKYVYIAPPTYTSSIKFFYTMTYPSGTQPTIPSATLTIDGVPVKTFTTNSAIIGSTTSVPYYTTNCNDLAFTSTNSYTYTGALGQHSYSFSVSGAGVVQSNNFTISNNNTCAVLQLVYNYTAPSLTRDLSILNYWTSSQGNLYPGYLFSNNSNLSMNPTQPIYWTFIKVNSTSVYITYNNYYLTQSGGVLTLTTAPTSSSLWQLIDYPSLNIISLESITLNYIYEIRNQNTLQYINTQSQTGNGISVTNILQGWYSAYWTFSQ